ncbi:phosphodiester glycosidase family protein [Alkalibacillus aidingensis]|uniref:phosphodiester glycosidase family protein n=1 Tax=Alkalibacillus aidingensis TaxID=2747607 RepID=UPI001660DB65|nr:phosphodiester glycosidase family protein [Alkalibacillus aidingensis]
MRQSQWSTVRWFTVLMVLSVVVLVSSYEYEASAMEVTDQWEVTPGVNYERQDESTSNSSRVMEIDLSETYLNVGLGTGEDFPSLYRTSTIARMLSEENHRVVGGINGSFFHFDSSRPSYLLSRDNQVLNLGAISADSSGYMSVPKAFAMRKDGKAMIDSYSIDLSYEIDGEEYDIDRFNGTRGSGETVLFTPSFRFDWTRTNEYGVEIHVHNVNRQLDSDEVEFGDTIEGEVKQIRRYGSNQYMELPEDGFVISIHGDSDIADDLEKGDPIKLTVDIDDQWKNTDFVLASGPQLVSDGKVDLEIDPDSSRAKEVAPRTAIGINEDGSNVFMITVDGRQPGYSQGMNLMEFAEYVEGLGVDRAINLDGGGSTTMVARQYGDVYPSVVNQPSGGFERGVANGLYAVVTDHSDNAEKIDVDLAQEGKVLAGAEVDVNLNYVLDEYFHPMDIGIEDIDFSVQGLVGRMDGSTFVAEQAGEGTIQASYQGATTSLSIEVVDEFDQVTIQPEDIQIGVNENQSFEVIPEMDDGSPVIWDSSTTDWSVTNEIGTIDENGEFTAASESRSGEVEASINGNTYSATVEVGGEDVVFDSFNDIDNWSGSAIRAEGDIRLTKDFEPVVQGDHALALDYEFNNKSGTSATYANFMGDVEIHDRPNEIGMWVYGDASHHWLRMAITDGDGQLHRLNVTAENELDWNGWRYVTAELPNNLTLPFTIDQIYITQPVISVTDSGTIFIDQVMLSYNDEEDQRDDLVNYQTVTADKEWKVTFDKPINRDSVSRLSMYVEDVDGNKYPLNYSFSDDDRVIRAKPQSDLDDGVLYQLVINSFIRSTDGYHKTDETTEVFQVSE